MDQRLQDYIAYYRVRAERASENPIYRESAAIEQERFDAIASCSELEEFKSKNEQGDYGRRLSIATVRDQAAARLAHYEATAQTVKAAGEQALLDVAAQASDSNDLMVKVGEVENKTMIAMTVDGFTRAVYDAFRELEMVEMAEKADVPEEWRAKDLASATQARVAAAAEYAAYTARAREYDPTWTLDYAHVWEDRHRRVIPVPDATLTRRISQHRAFVGRPEGEA